MAAATCPTCAKRFETEETRAMPFCSERCRQIDLGRWLNEQYGLPHESPEEELERPLESLSNPLSDSE